ncbi:hypothetical protein AVEN_15088-1 [Araneus ventricosus]|uniref:Uncharacterized protein n=1 Tax=Araneus ventricosus TaxID=182803 RepID=A0A4Y2QBI8_ARAVE|nr:hypothetical protein AVEN_15088-1 [Araneus ventricosus]
MPTLCGDAVSNEGNLTQEIIILRSLSPSLTQCQPLWRCYVHEFPTQEITPLRFCPFIRQCHPCGDAVSTEGTTDHNFEICLLPLTMPTSGWRCCVHGGIHVRSYFRSLSSIDNLSVEMCCVHGGNFTQRS